MSSLLSIIYAPDNLSRIAQHLELTPEMARRLGSDNRTEIEKALDDLILKLRIEHNNDVVARLRYNWNYFIFHHTLAASMIVSIIIGIIVALIEISIFHVIGLL